MSQDRFEALRGSRLAAELDEPQCRKLAGLMELVELKDGDVLECRIDGFEPMRNPVRDLKLKR